MAAAEKPLSRADKIYAKVSRHWNILYRSASQRWVLLTIIQPIFGEGALRKIVGIACAAGLKIARIYKDDRYRCAQWRDGDLIVRVLTFAEEEWSGDQEANTNVAVLDLAEASS
jgi:hypothetical protein